VDSNFNCIIETEALLELTRSHLHHKCGRPNIWETVPDSQRLFYCRQLLGSGIWPMV